MSISDKSFKSTRKKDVLDFLAILSSKSIATYTKLDFKDSLSEDSWGYTIQELKFNVDISTLKHIKPAGFSNIEVIVDIDVESKNSEWLNLNDPFISLSFRSLIKGTNTKTHKTHYLGYHVDRHNGAVANEIHPLYHIHFLQNLKALPSSEFNHGDSLQLDVPRVMHFPIELILGISTLLSNFSPKHYSNLLQDRQFMKLCKEYQERIWRPYVNSIENYWLRNPSEWTWDPKLNCPYLI